MKKLLCILFVLALSFQTKAQADKQLKIIEKPIIYNKERDSLSLEYLKIHHNIIKATPTITPKFIVLHYTAGGTIKSNFNYFNKVKIETARKINSDQSALNVSAHYLIDRDGTIYHLVADTLFARHAIGLNYCAIGIENIGSKTEPLTNEQVIANSNLIIQLCKKHKIEYVIGHSEYTKFKNTSYWKETNKNYITYKEDPGTNFLIEVRKKIKHLNLKQIP
jgi:N-acetylmuramoyl-L-alanine amidase